MCLKRLTSGNIELNLFFRNIGRLFVGLLRNHLKQFVSKAVNLAFLTFNKYLSEGISVFDKKGRNQAIKEGEKLNGSLEFFKNVFSNLDL